MMYKWNNISTSIALREPVMGVFDPVEPVRNKVRAKSRADVYFSVNGGRCKWQEHTIK